MNDLSNLTLIKFIAEPSDYDNCIDIASEGYLSIDDDDVLLAGDDPNPTRIRHFIARIDKQYIPNLITVLQDSMK